MIDNPFNAKSIFALSEIGFEKTNQKKIEEIKRSIIDRTSLGFFNYFIRFNPIEGNFCVNTICNFFTNLGFTCRTNPNLSTNPDESKYILIIWNNI